MTDIPRAMPYAELSRVLFGGSTPTEEPSLPKFFDASVPNPWTVKPNAEIKSDEEENRELYRALEPVQKLFAPEQQKETPNYRVLEKNFSRPRAFNVGAAEETDNPIARIIAGLPIEAETVAPVENRGPYFLLQLFCWTG